METKEKDFQGMVANGILMLFLNIATLLLTGYLGYLCAAWSIWLIIPTILLGIWWIIMMVGFVLQEPNEAHAMVFFGKYVGTFKRTGYFWVNPFISKKQVSMRARNMDVEPIKVNDKAGNPIMIGLVLVWRLKDTYKAMFEIDAQTMAGTTVNTSAVVGRMKAFEVFVKVQSDAALREVAGQYVYDNNDGESDELTLRSGGDAINDQLEQKLNERLRMAGIEIVEARLNYLAYAPEIAAVMLRRQQASAIISAREKIVEGAVSMVRMALEKLSAEAIVELDEDKKAAMVSNLLVVLCADESAQPVVNTGTLNQ
ncbi:MAG: SPFH domain-containing protein [Prevotellaceae bacterium]|jgi:regulator of protease activity HflC (stomatin/prohibitin superfamily)|nr:SPFH domain-containing protein [Prevotellaceae bacterium]